MTNIEPKQIKRQEKEICGIIMPLSDTEGYHRGQWADVVNILYEAIDAAGFEGKILSNSKVSNIIHEEIVKNLYSNPIVICDVSSKNPNVMFELGLRPAFDKPTIVIKDDVKDYNFDTLANTPYWSDKVNSYGRFVSMTII